MRPISILIADNSYLIRQGIRTLVNEVKDFTLVGEADTAFALSEKLLLCQPEVLIIDYASSGFCIDDIAIIRQQNPGVNILAITGQNTNTGFSRAIQSGVTSHLLKDCGKEEIIEAIRETAQGKQFMCGKIVDRDQASCEGIKVTIRETEIIRLIAESFSNKQIAEKLFLSVHTVTTHRKNIMNKLGVNNTAGLMMFALRENIIASQ